LAGQDKTTPEEKFQHFLLSRWKIPVYGKCFKNKRTINGKAPEACASGAFCALQPAFSARGAFQFHDIRSLFLFAAQSAGYRLISVWVRIVRIKILKVTGVPYFYKIYRKGVLCLY
jgi:hypothetical protein